MNKLSGFYPHRPTVFRAERTSDGKYRIIGPYGEHRTGITTKKDADNQLKSLNFTHE